MDLLNAQLMENVDQITWPAGMKGVNLKCAQSAPHIRSVTISNTKLHVKAT